jgi:hypothetical protein
MTLDEKIEQIHMADVKGRPREIPGIERLGIATGDIPQLNQKCIGARVDELGLKTRRRDVPLSRNVWDPKLQTALTPKVAL